MPSAAELRHLALQTSYRQSLGMAVANLSEARICRNAAEGNTFFLPPAVRFTAIQDSLVPNRAGESVDISFIKAFEGGRHDCAQYFGPASLPLNLTARLLSLLGSRTNKTNDDARKDCVVPIEIKTFSPTWHTREKVLIWKCEFTELQSQWCQVVIISTPQDPQFVALIPMHYIRKKTESPAKHLYLGSLKYKIDWTLHAMPAFPPEWEPYLLPVSQLPKALEMMRGYIRESEPTWRTPHTAVSFHQAPRPKLYPLSALQPDFWEWKAALNTAQPILRAFALYSQDWIAEFPEIAPVLGDIKLTHRSGTEVFVELKIEHCKVILDDDSTIPSLRHYQKVLGYLDRLMFSWKSGWDFIITVPEPFTGYEPKSHALCLPRDEIPEHWFNTSISTKLDSHGNPLLTWRSDEADWLDPYIFNLSDPRQMVQRLEEIFGSDPARMKASRRIPMGPLPLSMLSECRESVAYDDVPDGEPPAKGRSSGRPYRIGFGSPDHPFIMSSEVYEFWAFECLNEYCRKSGECIFLDLGRRNPMGQYAVALYKWTATDNDRYDQYGELPQAARHFHQRTPVLRVNFMRFRWSGQWHPTSLSKGAQYVKFGKIFEPSLVICDVVPPSCQRLSHNRFLVPSEILPKERQVNKRLRFAGKIINKAQTRSVVEGKRSGFGRDRGIYEGLKKDGVRALKENKAEEPEAYLDVDEAIDHDRDEYEHGNFHEGSIRDEDQGNDGADDQSGSILHQFSVDIDELSDTLQKLLSGEEEVVIGIGEIHITPATYCCFLGDMKQAGQISGVNDPDWDKQDIEED